MLVNHNDQVIVFDVDDTLVMWRTNNHNLTVVDPYDGSNQKLEIHARHVKLLTDHFHRGYQVIVWSAAGSRWAEAVVMALKLEPYVHVVMGKPIKYVDDLVANEFMGSRIYLDNK